MSNDSTSRSWFKWAIGALIALIGAAGGLVALLQYLDTKDNEKQLLYQTKLKEWEAFSPQSVSHGIQDAEILGGWYIDIDKGQVSMSMIGSSWDLQFNIDQSAKEGLRSNEGVEWSPLGVVDFSSVGYREIRDAAYSEPKHLDTRPQRKHDTYLYLSHVTGTPVPGYAFTLKTSDNNIALVQIHEYKIRPNGRRTMVLKYIVFPIESDPPKPRKP